MAAQVLKTGEGIEYQLLFLKNKIYIIVFNINFKYFLKDILLQCRQ